jgi:hypothetical protein
VFAQEYADALVAAHVDPAKPPFTWDLKGLFDAVGWVALDAPSQTAL